jgi:CubicO group peptidase (beta-lactamase class C family)
MIRYFSSFLLLLGGLFAQDTRRMTEIATAQAADNKFLGSILVAREGSVVFEKSYGLANAEWEIPNGSTTKFRIGSVTKQFTAVAILLLEERGKLKLEDPVSNHVPNAPVAWANVTILHLLAHTSGIPNFTSLPDYRTWKLNAGSVEQTLGYFRDLPLEFSPGEKWAYSNSGYILLGFIIERVSGQNYATFLTENILKPLGMNDSGYDSDTTILLRRASGYVRGGSGLANAPFVDMRLPHAAGGLYSTTGDLLRWTQGLFGGKILSTASLARMITPVKSDYALGLGVKTTTGRTVIDHGGGIEGFNAHLAYYPESKLTVVVLANVNGPAASELAGQLAAVAFDEPVKLASQRTMVAVPADVLQKYVGVYQLTPQITNSIRLVGGQLTTQLSGQPPFPIFPESETKFFLKVVDAQLEFVKDADGRVTHLVQYQNGRSQKAPRISEKVVDRTAIEVPRTIKESYVGTYELRSGFNLVITFEGDQLMSQATSQEKFPIFPESPTTFFLKVVDAQIEFVKNEQGKVDHLILHQAGQHLKATRK